MSFLDGANWERARVSASIEIELVGGMFDGEKLRGAASYEIVKHYTMPTATGLELVEYRYRKRATSMQPGGAVRFDYVPPAREAATV